MNLMVEPSNLLEGKSHFLCYILDVKTLTPQVGVFVLPKGLLTQPVNSFIM
jgi:hypothetical protein